MGYAALELPMTAADFIAWEATQAMRHEFVAGEIFAMAGANEAHGIVSGNVYMALRQHLAGTPCRTFITDMKLRVEAANAYFYPDVMVTCSAADARDPLVKREPTLVVEVLSLATAGYDRGGKFAAYRALPSLHEYLVIDIDSRRSDLYRKNADGLWVLHPFEADDAVQLKSLELSLSAAALWAEVPAPESSDADPKQGHA